MHAPSSKYNDRYSDQTRGRCRRDKRSTSVRDKILHNIGVNKQQPMDPPTGTEKTLIKGNELSQSTVEIALCNSEEPLNHF